MNKAQVLMLIWRIEWRVCWHPASRHERRGWRKRGMGWFGIPGFAAHRIRNVEWAKNGLGLAPLSWHEPSRGLVRKTLDLFTQEPTR